MVVAEALFSVCQGALVTETRAPCFSRLGAAEVDGGGDREVGGGAEGPEGEVGVAESARAHSYFFSKQVQKTLQFLAVHVLAVNALSVNRPFSLYVVTKNVFCALNGVKTWLIHPI